MIRIVALFLLVYRINALNLGLCSSQNSGSNFDSTSSQFMSIGLCRTTCIDDDYTYAVVSGNSCWCSNELPDSSTDMDNCDVDCAGYPSEKCASQGYFGYINVGSPGLSLSVSSSSSSKTSTSKTSTSEQQSQTPETTSSTSPTETSTQPSSTTSSSSKTSTSSKTSSKASSKTSSKPSSTTEESSTNDVDSTISSLTSEAESSAEPTTFFSVTTVSGNQTILIKTEFITSLPSSSSSSASSPDASITDGAAHNTESESNNNSGSKNSFFDSKGKVAGTFTAVGVVVLGLISSILYCCCCHNRNKDGGAADGYTDEENQYSSDESINKTPVLKSGTQSLKRDNSSLSIRTLLGKESVGGLSRNLSKKRLNSPKEQHPVDFNDLMMFPITEFESNKPDGRLEPLFVHNNQSTQTFNDEVDYSRKLKITNPDDEKT